MFYIRFTLLVALACTSTLGVYGSQTPLNVHKINGGKIVGGSETTIQKFPYQVFLLLKEGGFNGQYYQCGGSIVNKRCILTAAHCLIDIESAEIRVGSTNAFSGGTTYNSRLLLRHPQYNDGSSDYDVGVIKLLRSIRIDGKNSSTINFPANNCSVAPGTNLTVTGWGETTESSSFSGTLRAVTVDAVSAADCKKTYPNLTDRMLCAGVPEGGKGPCQGDLGGPLVMTGTNSQLGIVSSGIGCGRSATPSIYTNLCNSDIQRFLRDNGCA